MRDMRRADGEAETIGCADGQHGGNFRGRALTIGEMVFANFFSYRHYDRFQPTIVPNPRAMATATFTHVGINRVEWSICFL